MVQANIKKEFQRNKAVIVVFALSPALGRILLMVSVRATFHYQSSIMWRPPAGPPGRHLCQVRSTTRPVCGQAEQIMPSYGLLGHNYRARRTGGSGYDVIEEIEADCGFCRRRRVSLDEEVTGLPANSCPWLHQPQLPQLSSRQPAHDLLPFCSMFYPERAVSNHY